MQTRARVAPHRGLSVVGQKPKKTRPAPPTARSPPPFPLLLQHPPSSSSPAGQGLWSPTPPPDAVPPFASMRALGRMHRARGASGDVRARGPGFIPRYHQPRPLFPPSRNRMCRFISSAPLFAPTVVPGDVGREFPVPGGRASRAGRAPLPGAHGAGGGPIRSSKCLARLSRASPWAPGPTAPASGH